MLLLLTPHAAFPPPFAQLPARRVHAYTLLQLLALAACWLVFLNPTFGLCVSFVVVSLVPLRAKVLPCLFSAAELAVLDAPPRAAAPDADADEAAAAAMDGGAPCLEGGAEAWGSVNNSRMPSRFEASGELSSSTPPRSTW